MARSHTLKLRKIGIDTYQEAVIYMRKDCHICRAEGFEVHARILVTFKDREIIATLNTLENGFLQPGEAALSLYAWNALGVNEGDLIQIQHPSPVTSLGYVRTKIYGKPLTESQIRHIINDIGKGFYSDIHIAAFITACAAGRLSVDEIIFLSNEMVSAGDKLHWPQPLVVDKHCIGGLPGNRTTLIVVPIVSAFGLTMPKTSSRAITSAAGTADVMEVFAPVNLSIQKMKQVVEKENGCIVWGGSVFLSPVDDILIGVERTLDIDSEGQLIASVLSKKIAAGSTHALIDIPVGPSAKVRTQEAALSIKSIFEQVAKKLDITIKVLLTDGVSPVGNGIGPALEAQDVLKVLQGHKDAPKDLRERALMIAANILEFSKDCPKDQGLALATQLLDSGKAFEKFQKICDAQGGMSEIPKSKYTYIVESKTSGVATSINNRALARLAKLAGAPHDKAAGIQLNIHLGDPILKEQPLFTLYAESLGELNYAKGALSHLSEIIHISQTG